MSRSAALSNSAPGTTVGSTKHVRTGVVFAICAYGLWGILPLYFRWTSSPPATPPLEVLAHRIIWSFALLAGIVLWSGRSAAVREILRQPRTLLILTTTTLLIAANWLVFIWAVATNHVLQASLGYYINPLINVLLGAVFLRERLRVWQAGCVLLAAIGVGYLTVSQGAFPTLALFLAGSFGVYGLLRKTVNADALLGLTIETTLLAPFALGYLGYLLAAGAASFGQAPIRSFVLMCAGPITAVPLLLFTAAARRLRLTTMGIIQYLAPTGHFLCAILVSGEQFTTPYIVAFGCIWAALIAYTGEALWQTRATAEPAPAAPLD